MSKKPKPRSERTEWKPPASFSAIPAVATEPEPAEPKRSKVSDVVVEEVPPHCPKCKSTDRTRKEGSLTRNYKGTAKDGRPFNRLRWSYCRCLKCGQAYRVISREMTGE